VNVANPNTATNATAEEFGRFVVVTSEGGAFKLFFFDKSVMSDWINYASVVDGPAVIERIGAEIFNWQTKGGM
jgi:hypothetical protein